MRGAFNLGGSQKTSKPFRLGVCLLLSCLCVFSVGCSAIRSVIGIGTEKSEGALLSEDALLQYIEESENALLQHSKNVPTRIGDATDWKAVSAGSYHSLAIKKDGSLWAWGYNREGQLGDGTAGNYHHKSTPVRVGAANDWKAISAGGEHSLAIKTDGSLWAWGSNWLGQLGDSTGGDGSEDNDKNIPVRIGGATDWKAISAGGEHSLAIKTDGSLWAWGWNSYGQLGDGTGGDEAGEHNKNVPTRIGDATDWKTVSAGGEHSLAIKTDGSLWAWGKNWYGSLGDGIDEDNNVPVRIGDAVDWKVVSAGGTWVAGGHFLGIKSDGSLWAWGANEEGQLGDGTRKHKGDPVCIGDATDWKTISAGESRSVGIRSDGSLWVWGDNYRSRLGDGMAMSKGTPIRIGTGIGWQTVSGGSAHSLAIKDDGSLWAWGDNLYGELGDGR